MIFSITFPLTPKMHHITFEKIWLSCFSEEVNNGQMITHETCRSTQDNGQRRTKINSNRSPDLLKLPKNYYKKNKTKSPKKPQGIFIIE